MGESAAFFDLDRTVLRGPSGPLLGEALATAGLMSRARVPAQDFLLFVYGTIGETLPGMALARQAAGRAAGWAQAAAQEAGEMAADALAGLVQPFVKPLLARHHQDGRPVVLATTTPHDLIAPLARRLGFDDVIATRYATDGDGRYTGGLDGPFVWGMGKLAAVRAWADAHGVDVGQSWAYSDSVYDVPLLSAVAHPHAVNPDPRLRVVALARRWPVLHLDVPPGVPKLPVLRREPFRLLIPFLRPELFPFARFDIEGTHHIPPAGPAIVVANHRSYFDTAAVAITLARSGRPVRFLGKKEVFDAPVVGALARAMGGIRVERGSGSDEPLRAAAEALEAGEVVALMPQGTIPRGPDFFDPVLRGRPGAARLAAMTKAPVVPLGLWGTEQVWPRSSRLPNVANVTSPPTVVARVGPPVALTHRSGDADTKRIMAAIADLLPAEARRRREPTPEELARTYPPGKAPG